MNGIADDRPSELAASIELEWSHSALDDIEEMPTYADLARHVFGVHRAAQDIFCGAESVDELVQLYEEAAMCPALSSRVARQLRIVHDKPVVVFEQSYSSYTVAATTLRDIVIQSAFGRNLLEHQFDEVRLATHHRRLREIAQAKERREELDRFGLPPLYPLTASGVLVSGIDLLFYGQHFLPGNPAFRLKRHADQPLALRIEHDNTPAGDAHDLGKTTTISITQSSFPENSPGHSLTTVAGYLDCDKKTLRKYRRQSGLPVELNKHSEEVEPEGGVLLTPEQMVALMTFVSGLRGKSQSFAKKAREWLPILTAYRDMTTREYSPE